MRLIMYFFLIYNSLGFCQEKNIFINDTIKFYVQKERKEITFPHYLPTPYRIFVPLSSEDSLLVSSLDKSDWIRLLNDERTSWNTYLILMSLHRREAPITIVICQGYKCKEEWFIYSRRKDIEFWTNYLK